VSRDEEIVMENFAGRVAVITGAGSGFGREFAGEAARLGMKLVLADVDAHALEQAASALQAGGADVLAMVCDVSKAAHVEELADAALIRYNGVHLLFNNAGVGTAGLIWEYTEADWDWVLGVNLWGVIHGVRVFTPLMLDAARRDPAYEGHIVNTASMAGLLVPPVMGPYNVSKHAVVALSETLYHDLRLVDAKVQASVLCPYFVPTAIAQSERHRPGELRHDAAPTPSQQAGQALLAQAVAAGKLSAADVARITFDGIRRGDFYIHTHPQALQAVAQRMDAIVQGKPPADPYAATPQFTDMLRAAVKG
jgi:NAD(P)-dependent dehydrogenase (short-subunit alcohol dehydrogenase family)